MGGHQAGHCHFAFLQVKSEVKKKTFADFWSTIFTYDNKIKHFTDDGLVVHSAYRQQNGFVADHGCKSINSFLRPDAGSVWVTASRYNVNQ